MYATPHTRMFGDVNPYEMEGPIHNPQENTAGMHATNPINPIRHATVHVHVDDEDSDYEPICVTYGPEQCPEVLVNAIYQRFNPSSSNEAAYKTHGDCHVIVVHNGGRTLWNDNMRCTFCSELRAPYLDGICPRCRHTAPSLFSYNLPPNAEVVALIGAL
jgi:hypothetical protein